MPNKLQPRLGVDVFRTPAGELAIAQIEDSPEDERVVFLRFDEVPVLIDILKREMRSENELPPAPPQSGVTN
jgi:hypothetical protein